MRFSAFRYSIVAACCRCSQPATSMSKNCSRVVEAAISASMLAASFSCVNHRDLERPLYGRDRVFEQCEIGVATGSVVIFVIAYYCGPWLRTTATRPLLGVGLCWVALTLLFELALGRLVLHLSWDRVLSDYGLLRGGLLMLGLVVLALSPLIATKLRGRIRQTAKKAPAGPG
jgi:hypothetical protein